MIDRFLPSVASDLAASLVANVVEKLGGPAVDGVRDKLFWNTLMARVVRKLCSGYDGLEAVEGEALAIDERFFRDPVVRREFTVEIVAGKVDRRRLQERFVALYGESQAQLFDRNLNDAVDIFRRELKATLPPAVGAKLSRIATQIEEEEVFLDERLQESTQAILKGQAHLEHLVLETGSQILERMPMAQASFDVDRELASEYKVQLDQAHDLLQASQPRIALDQLLSLKERIWERASIHDKYRLLASMGFAHFLLGEESAAAQHFIEALVFEPNSAKALANAAVGYLLQGKRDLCERCAHQALTADPTVLQAHSMLVQAASPNEPFDSVVAKVPEVYRDSVEVSMALGQVARQRGLLVEAEKWFRGAVQKDVTNHPEPPGALADVLLTRAIQEDPSPQMVGVVTPRSAFVTEAVERYDSAWARVSRTDMRSLRVNWLVNRALAKALLGRVADAITDTEEALTLDPGNAYLIKQRALLAHQDGDLPRAASLFRSILGCSETPDARFWLSVVLVEDERLKEAADFAAAFLEDQTTKSREWREASRLLAMIKLDLGSVPEARAIAEDLRSLFPEDPSALVLSARVARYEGRDEDVRVFLAEAQANLPPHAHLAVRLLLTEELYESEDFEAAARLLEEVVDPQVNSAPARQLLTCYYRSGNLEPALRICNTLRKNYGPLRLVTEIESAIYEEIGDLPMARQVCQQYLELFPMDLGVRLRLAVVNYRLREFQDLDGFLSEDIHRQNIRIRELPFASYGQLAHLYLARHQVRGALEVAYEGRRRFFDDPNAHLVYVQIFLRCTNGDSTQLNSQEVGVDSAVRIDDSGKGQRWVVIEDRDDAEVQKGELRPSHPVAKRLLGRKVGDSVTLSHGFYSDEIVIADIKSKFVYAFHEVLESYQLQFPETPGILRIPVQLPVEGRGDLNGLRPIFRMLDDRQKYEYEAERLYQQGMLPIGSLAEILGKNPIEVQAGLSAMARMGVRCCSGRQDERDEAVSLLHAGPRIILDFTSLMTMQQLGIGDAVVALHGKPGLVRESLDLVEELLNDQQIHTKEYMILGKEGDQYVRTLVTAEQLEHNRQVLEGVLSWAQANCEIVPCTAALAVNREERRKLGDLIGPSSVATILAVGHDNTVLYSDDAALRNLAMAEYAVPGVWTQAMLINLRQRQAISQDAYRKSVLRLASLHYYETSIDADVLLEASRQAEWHPGYPFSKAIALLSGKHADQASAVRVAVEYIYRLWEQRATPLQYESLVTAILDALALDRERRDLVFKAFDRAVRVRFGLVPTEIDHIRRLMRAWAQFHVV